MGLYREQVVPRLVDWTCGSKEISRGRTQAAAGLSGRVVGLDGQQIPSMTRAATGHCSPSPSAPCPTRLWHWPRCGACSAPAGRCTSWSTACPRTPASQRGNTASNPSNGRLADRCHLTRDSSSLAEAAGFVTTQNEQRHVRSPKPWSWFTLGVAAKPASAA